MRRFSSILAALLGCAALAACSGEETAATPAPDEDATDPAQDPAPAPRPADDPRPPSARWEQAQQFLDDRAALRHASDGGGAVELVLAEGEVARVEAMASATWTLRYTAGEHGLATDGALHFMPDPFWGWSPPQTWSQDRPGYTTVTTERAGVVFEYAHQSAGAGMAGTLIARLSEGELQPGDEVLLVYGAGRLGAFADRHAERDSRLWLLVDGDGDGIRGLVEDCPSIEVVHGPLTRLVLHGPSVARAGEQVTFTVALLDPMANRVTGDPIEVELTQRPPDWNLPETVSVDADGVATFTGTAAGRGVARLGVRFERDGVTLAAEANPLVVLDEVPRVRWADLHGHSNLSDGTGHPDDWWEYARDVAALDAACLTDHDHWGMRFLDDHPELWEGLQASARRVHAPGSFVALIGYEWTSWVHGHRHVLHFGDEATLRSSLNEATDDPRELWSALEGEPALTIAHHSAGDPVPVNWSFRPPEHLEPVTEIVSVHGSSEAMDSPELVRRAQTEYTVRYQLDQGLRLGFLGSGDGHDGHPGLAHLSPVYGWRTNRTTGARMGRGGLAAILSEDLTRESLLEALRARRCYATSGPRILVHTTLGGHPIGAVVPREGLEARLELLVVGTAPIRFLDLVYPDRVERTDAEDALRIQVTLDLPQLPDEGYLYLRVIQEDGAMAWTSPWFFE